MSPLLKVSACACRAREHALATLSLLLSPCPRVSLCSFSKHPAVHCGHHGLDQSCLSKPAHFLRQPRSNQTQQKHICCLFPLVFRCYPTEDKAPRLSNGRESLTPPKPCYIWTLRTAAKLQMDVLYTITESRSFSPPPRCNTSPENTHTHGQVADGNTERLSAVTSVQCDLSSTSYIKAAPCKLFS